MLRFNFERDILYRLDDIKQNFYLFYKVFSPDFRDYYILNNFKNSPSFASRSYVDHKL